ncbi:MAG: TetR/AcrR family transcriptional regulator [Sphingomonas sp.]
MADHILAHGLAAASLRPLAKAAGTSDRMLLYYFADKDELLAATLGEIGARLALLLDAQVGAAAPQRFAPLLTQMREAFRAPAYAPYVRLWLDVAARAAAGDALFVRVGRGIADGFAAWAAARLDAPDDAARGAQASLLLATVDGMAMLDAVGHRTDLDRALTVFAD